jgi:2-polyprenyl-3-methyl-5-hydroxy-6-metoxy-1,4-benzoquinol methylase
MMKRWSDLSTRHRQPEVMDQPGLDQQAHAEALHSLARINFWSGSVGVLWPELRSLAKRLGVDSLTVLDLATGAGDVPLGLWAKARRAGLNLQIDAYDVSRCAVDVARAQASSRKASVEFEQRDVLADPPTKKYDAVICSLFMHHLDEPEAVKLLRVMAGAARHLVLVNDLERSVLGYFLVKLATRLLSRSPVVWVDGPRSVEGAFSLAEVRELARQAGLADARIVRRHPCRFLLSWSPSRSDGDSTGS